MVDLSKVLVEVLGLGLLSEEVVCGELYGVSHLARVSAERVWGEIQSREMRTVGRR